MAVIDQLVLRGLNHLLAGESWATERLRPFAGAQVRIDAGPLLALSLGIDEHGAFRSGDTTLPPDVTISLPADLPARFLVDRSQLFSAAKLSGSVDLAEALAFVFRNLEWDVEADLAGVVGDIPARRLTLFGGSFLRQAGEGLLRTARNVAEYATEDSDLLAPPRELTVFCDEVNALRDDLARLEKRVERFLV